LSLCSCVRIVEVRIVEGIVEGIVEVIVEGIVEVIVEVIVEGVFTRHLAIDFIDWMHGF
jgi:hypothetical protein